MEIIMKTDKKRVAQFSGPEPDKSGIFGEPGDQLDPVYRDDDFLGGEVDIIPLDPKAWTKIFRPVRISTADDLAEQMAEAAHNPNVGYSQGPSRYTFGDALLLFTSASEIDYPVNGDCSSGVSGILRAAWIPVRRGMVTSTEQRDLLDTGEFIVIDDPVYLSDQANYWRGDVLWRSGHTAVCLDGSSDPLPMIATGKCYRRIGPGILYRSIAYWKKGEQLNAYPGTMNDKWIITSEKSGDNRAFTSNVNLAGQICYGGIRVTGLTVWIREQPNKDSAHVKLARYGQIYVWTGAFATDNRGIKWYEVETENGYGWISEKYSEVIS